MATMSLRLPQPTLTTEVTSPIASLGRDFELVLRSCLKSVETAGSGHFSGEATDDEEAEEGDQENIAETDHNGAENPQVEHPENADFRDALLLTKPEGSHVGAIPTIDVRDVMGGEEERTAVPTPDDEDYKHEGDKDISFSTDLDLGTSQTDSTDNGMPVDEKKENSMLDHRLENGGEGSGHGGNVIIKALHPRSLVYPQKKKPEKRKTRKMQGKNKKWKPISEDMVEFSFSLLPRRAPGCDSSDEMDRELVKFENACAIECESTESTSSTSNSARGDVDACPLPNAEVQTKGEPLPPVSLRQPDESYWGPEADCYNDPSVLDLEDKTTVNDLKTCLRFCGRGRRQHLRAKKKWRRAKTRKQVKTKQCLDLNNMYHGEKLFIHHRLSKIITAMVGKSCTYFPGLSMKEIDKKRAVDCKTWKEAIGKGPRQTPARGRTPYIPPDRNRPPNPAGTLTAYNADGDLPPEVVNLLISIQDRDLTPEDYDLLLRLDERVEAKGVQAAAVEAFKADVVEEGDTDETCAVCMEAYTVGEARKYLPCGHRFHSDCLKAWLESSTKCPLDGLEVEV